MRISYSNKDFQDIKDQLIDMIPDLTDRWTDHLESDIGIVSVTQMAAVGDLLSYCLDRQAGEVYPDSAQERKNIKSAFSIVGYKLRHYVSSHTKVIVKSLVTQQFILKKYTHLQTKEDVRGDVLKFVVDDDYVIPFSDGVIMSEKEIGILQGSYDFIERGYNDIFKDNRFIISREEGEAITENSTRLTINDVEWEEVEDVYLMEKPMGKYYHMEVDIDDNVVIVLHPRWRDLISFPKKVEIKVEFVLSDGEEGNIGPNSIDGFSDEVPNNYGDDVSDQLFIIQNNPARGGANPETNEEARILGPRRARTTWTAITRQDYEVLSERDPEVYKAKCVDVNDQFVFKDQTIIDEPFIVRVAVVPYDLELPSMSLRQRVYNYLAERKVGTLDLGVIEPEYIDVDIEATVSLKGDYPASEAEKEVKTALEKFFFNLNFEDEVNMATIMSVILGSSKYVKNVVLTLPDEDLETEGIQFARLGDLTLSFD